MHTSIISFNIFASVLFKAVNQEHFMLFDEPCQSASPFSTIKAQIHLKLAFKTFDSLYNIAPLDLIIMQIPV